jgi:hypothetical protein
MALRWSETKKKKVYASGDRKRFNVEEVRILGIQKVASWSLSLGPARQLGSGRLENPGPVIA